MNADRSEMNGERERKARRADQMIFGDVDEATLVEARESDRGDCSHFELLVEETLEDEVFEALCIGSSVEEVAEDHVLDELDGGSSCMPLGTGADMFQLIDHRFE